MEESLYDLDKKVISEKTETIKNKVFEHIDKNFQEEKEKLKELAVQIMEETSDEIVFAKTSRPGLGEYD